MRAGQCGLPAGPNLEVPLGYVARTPGYVARTAWVGGLGRCVRGCTYVRQLAHLVVDAALAADPGPARGLKHSGRCPHPDAVAAAFF